MFTVCPKCMLTLAVTATDLRMGQGYVRCGRCANVFNALLALSEEPVEEQTAPPTPADPASESQITAALREDHPAPADATAVSAAADDIVPDTPAPQTEQAVVESEIESASTYAEGTGTFETIVLEGEAITQTEEYVPEESVDSEIASLTRQLAANARLADAADAAQAAQEPAAGGDLQAAEATATPAEEAETASFAEPEQPAAGPRWPWIAGSTVLALALLVQMLHHWRDALASHPSLNGPVTRLYAALGMPLEPHWDLGAYEVRQQGAAADGADSELVHVRLSLANHAPRAQPLPLLRLTLLDRYGKRIARGNLSPPQYWPGGHPPHPLLAHDERVDCEVVVRDPGAVSASFELDVCLRDASGQLRCAADLPAR